MIELTLSEVLVSTRYICDFKACMGDGGCEERYGNNCLLISWISGSIFVLLLDF